MRLFRLLIVFALGAVAVPGSLAQPATAPSIIAAEQAFERGLRAYSAGQFEAARDAFLRVAHQYEFNQRTTSATLMAGRAMLAAGDFEGSASEMTAFISRYPRSRYVDAARQVRREATARVRDRRVQPAVTEVGVLLPMGERDIVFTQALFNGIRLAIDAHNERFPERPVRMVFRDSAPSAATALASLAAQGVRVAIGPMYSEEAVEAGRAAERERVVLVTPLATDTSVSEGRRFVFQANPTFPVRGRAMARFAYEEGLREVGVVATAGSLGDDMAASFVNEFEGRGGSVPFYERLPQPEAWFQLPERIGAQRLAQVEAVYMPVTGSGADEHAAGALRGLDLMIGDDATGPRILANAEWQNLRASRPRAERFRAAFTNDFFLGAETPEERAFVARYQALADVVPDRVAYKGYDVASMVVELLADQPPGADLAERLRDRPPFEGLAHTIDFAGRQVNQHLFFLRFRGNDVEALR